MQLKIIKNKKTNIDKTIDTIQSIRELNNKLWMDLLRLSIKHSPFEASKILKGINKNDKKISKLLGEI